jgi:hypothetical protein
MPEFYKDKTYCIKIDDSKTIYLGRFMEYIGLPYVGDWLYDAKARFEHDVITKGQYRNVFSSSVPAEKNRV